MTRPTDDLQIDRIDPTSERARLLPIRDRDGKVYRAALGDAYAIIEPGDDGRLRIPYVQAEGDVRMKHLLTAVVDAVGMNSKTTRTLRFVSPRKSDDPLERALRKVSGGNAGPALDEVLNDYTEVKEPWPEDAPEDDDVALCFDVEWHADPEALQSGVSSA
jgi:hypothetical protein